MSGTYQSREASTHDAQPIEAYLFQGPSRAYTYTSADVIQTVNGTQFQPIPIRRTAIRAGTSSEDSLDVEIRLPVYADLVTDYAFGIPPATLTLTVYRLHLGTNQQTDYAVYWTGAVTGISIDEREARVRVPSVFGVMLSGELPSVHYQTPCNHVLFDARCQVTRASYTVVTSCTDVADRVLNVASTGGHPDGFFVGGEVITAGGERRMVIHHLANQLTVNFPFAGLEIGHGVSVSAGCDHSAAMCKARFNNKANFGGFEHIPALNPFVEGL